MSTTPVTIESLQAELAVTKAKLEAEKNRPLTLKVSEKGACSVYGMGRFPVTLYVQQWEKLFTNQDMIKTFLVANASKLTTKE